MKLRNNTVFIVLSPELGLAELLLQSFQTGRTHLQPLMSLSQKLLSGLPFYLAKRIMTELASEELIELGSSVVHAFRSLAFFTEKNQH